MSNFLLNALAQTKNVAISGHIHPDGDCIGSCMGLYNYILENYHFQPDVYLEPIAESYKVVNGYENIKSAADQDKVYDLFISIDSSDLDRLGFAKKYFDTAKKTICIDHHMTNTGFAQENHIIPKASSASEVLYDLLEEENVSKNTADCLYMGIMCDTGCFKHSNTLEHTMCVAGKLISKGVNTSQMIDGVFFEKTYLQNRILGQCLLNSQLYLDGKCIVCAVDLELMKAYNVVSSDLEGVIDQMRITKGVEVAILLKESETSVWKISMRSKNDIDVAKIAGYYGGGGHIKAAGAAAKGNVNDIIHVLVSKVEEQLVNV